MDQTIAFPEQLFSSPEKAGLAKKPQTIAFDLLLRAFAPWFENSRDKSDRTLIKSRENLLYFWQNEGDRFLLSSTVFDPAWYAATYVISARGKKATQMVSHYMKVGVPKGHDPTAWFSEEFYRNAYPDVREGISAGLWHCGYQHYLTRGMTEHRSPSSNFSELAYLGRNSDVLEAVRAGRVPSGFLHHVCSGELEARVFEPRSPTALLELPVVPDCGVIEPSDAFAEDLYLNANHDVRRDALDAGMQHWLAFGLKEDLRGIRARIPAYIDNLYLRDNPDIAHSVRLKGQPSGYHHFLMYGASERRSWAGSSWQRMEARHLARALYTRTTPPERGPDNSLPLISVIVPVYNPEISALRECIASVRKQTYQNWELVLADDGSFRPEIFEILVAAERRDPRIRAVFSERNSGISAASNLALANSHGEFVALLDHDDLLAPDALLHVAQAASSQQDVDLVYTDEAKLTEDDKPIAINPKPGWSPELLLSTMYIGHLTTYRRSVIEQVGGFRSMFDGTQDYDLALRVSEVVRSVVHVPLPLYFWRLSSSSTAGSLAAKPHVLDRQREALENALLRRRQRGTVQPGHSPGHWSVMLEAADEPALVSIVIPTAGRMATIGETSIDLLINCIHSINQSETYRNYEFVVVHNDDLRSETLLDLARFRNLRLVAYQSAPFNLAEKINLGVRAAAGHFVLLLNDDMQAASGPMIQSMLGRMFDGVGIVGGRLLYANGTLQHSGIVWTAEGPTHAAIGEHLLTPGPAERLRVMHNCFGVSGACMFFRRDVFLDCGGFSPRLPTNYNDVDLCLRIREQGLRVVFNPDVTLYHFEAQSKAGTHFWELQLLLLTYPDVVDPFWNPTFSLHSPFYELRDPDTVERQSYRAWLMQRIAARQSTLTKSTQIRFSIFMSVYQNRKHQMEELAATIFNQSYDNWEWVIVDDGSTLLETIEWLDQVRHREKVRFIRLETNQGIMAGYGAAFRTATGDYVLPVDADDFLTLDCLQVLATAIEAGDYPDALYSDEDKATEKGTTHSPFLKPDWDPVLFTNVCYVCHVCAIKREIAEAVDAYTDLDAAWCHDWDTFLRLQRAGARIIHVPEVLYSWRIHAGSTASIETGNKPQTIASQKHVLDQHLRLTGLDRAYDVVQNELFPHNGIWRLKPLRSTIPRSAVLIVASADVDRMSGLLLDVARAMSPNDAILIVDGSEHFDGMLEELPSELKHVLGPRGLSRLRQRLSLHDALTLCAEEDRRVVAVLDATVARVSRDWLREGIGMFAAEPDVGAVGGQILLPDGHVAWRGGFRGFGGMAGSPDYGRAQTDSGYYGLGWCQRTCDAVPSVCFFARTDILQDAVVALGERPLGLRELAGQVTAAVWRASLRIVYTPFVQVTIARNNAVDPILRREVVGTKGPQQNYYHSAFGRRLDTAYGLRNCSDIVGFRDAD